MAGIQIMDAGSPIASQALSLDFGAGLHVEMDRNVVRLSAPAAGSDANYVHDQLLASATWDVIHNLGKFPAVTVVDSAGDVCIGDVHYVSANRVALAFRAPFSGQAFLN